MSLFPAYEENDRNCSKNEAVEQDWLEIKSYPVTKHQNKDVPARNRSVSTSESPDSDSVESNQKRKSKSQNSVLTESSKHRRKSRSESRSSSPSTSSESHKRSKRYQSKRRYRSKSKDRHGRGRSRSRDRQKRSKKFDRRSKSPEYRHKNKRTRSEDIRKRPRSTSSDSKSRKNDSKSRKHSRKSKKDGKRKSIPSMEELVAKHSTNQIFLEDVGLKPEDAFRQDQRGNGQYIKFKSLPFAETAHYKRRWKMKVLTTSGEVNDYKFDRKSLRYYNKDFQKSFLRPEKSGILVSLGTERQNLNQNHVQKNILKFDQTSDEKPECESNQENDDTEINFKIHEIQLKTRAFNEKLRSTPHDEKLWLEFVDFQDEAFVGLSFEDEGNNKKSSKKSGSAVLRQNTIAEKKLSILKNAEEKNPLSVIIAVKRLQISAQILDTQSLVKQWKELLATNPTDFDLWRAYIHFSSTQSSGFTVGKMVKVLSSCFKAFSSLPMPDEDQLIFVIQAIANLWVGAGHRERGIGLYQALMELNLNSPTNVPIHFTLGDKLIFLEQFWDQVSIPKFGDSDSEGWAEFLTKKKKPEQKHETGDDYASNEEELISDAGGNVPDSKLWLELEIRRETNYWHPSNSSEEEDPDRIVAFDDIKPFLFQFKESKSHFKLILSFLQCVGWSHSPVRSSFDFNNIDTETMESWIGLLEQHSTSPELDGSLLRRCAPSISDNPKLESFVRNIFSQAIRLIKDPLRTQLCVLWLLFEQQRIEELTDHKEKKKSIKDVKNSVKNLLENDRNNLNIYCSYAAFILKFDSYQSATKILKTLLAVEKSSFLFRSAVSLELEAHNQLMRNNSEGSTSQHLDEALWLLALFSTGQQYRQRDMDKVSLLSLCHKAKSSIINKINSIKDFKYDGPDPKNRSPVVLQSGNFDLVFGAIWLATLLDRESSEGSDLLNEVCKQLHLKEDFENKVLFEHLNVKLRLDVASFGCDHQAPSRVRPAFSLLLDQNPNNSKLLQGLVHNAGLRPTVADPLWRQAVRTFSDKNRTSFRGIVLIAQILISRFVDANQEEDGFSTVASGFLNKASAILEEATVKDETKQAVLIWRLLMWITKTLSEIYPKKHSNSIKSIYYRAIQECPGSKVLYLDLANYISDNAELQSEIEEMMNEKEVRIRLPMEELKVLLEPEEVSSD